MKSIQTKIIVLIMAVVILCSTVVGGIGVFHLKNVSNQNSAQIMNLSCREEGKRIEHILHSIEQSVKIIAHNSVVEQNMEVVLKSDTLRNILIEKLRPILLAAGKSTEGAVAVYVHFNPEIAPSDSGIFLSKVFIKESFHEEKVTDFAKVNMQEMYWYLKPVEAKGPVWLDPYYNRKIEQEVISYVVPIYQKNILVGVAGMDVMLSDITKYIDEMKVFENKEAYLVNNENQIIYPSDGEKQLAVADETRWQSYVEKYAKSSETKPVLEYRKNGDSYKLAMYQLDNNMRLVLTVPTAEIDAENNKLLSEVVGTAIVISVVGIAIAIAISQGIIRPLKELTKASEKIAQGNLKIKLPTDSKDEVGILADSLQQTVDCLRVYMDRMSDLAYTDPLTGVKSKTAYTGEIRKIEQNIQNGFTQFGLTFFDMNGLKEMNDTYGHDTGDSYIKNACRLICSTYKHSPVFRIGGDEFVVVLTGQDLLNSGKLLRRFYEDMEEINRSATSPSERISVAAGMAVFKEGKDTGFKSVYKRADENMYKNKISMKSGKGHILEIEEFES